MPTEFVHPNGERLTFTKTTAETGGEYLEIEATYHPQSPQPPAHYHPRQEERFEVLSGTFRLAIDGEEQTYKTGERFTIPAKTPHALQNIGDEEGRLRWQVRPALKTQDFFATLWGLATEGQSGESGTGGLLQLAVILNAYRDEFRTSDPPYILQRLAFSLLAAVGRLRGYRARYDRFSGEAAAEA